MKHKTKSGLINLGFITLAIVGIVVSYNAYPQLKQCWSVLLKTFQTEGLVTDRQSQQIKASTKEEDVLKLPRDQKSPEIPEDTAENSFEKPPGLSGLSEFSEHSEFSGKVKGTQTWKDWARNQLEKCRDKIEEEDLKDLESIIDKLDIDLMTDLLEDPDEQAGERALRLYLRTTLGKAGYDRAKELFMKYSFIIFE